MCETWLRNVTTVPPTTNRIWGRITPRTPKDTTPDQGQPREGFAIMPSFPAAGGFGLPTWLLSDNCTFAVSGHERRERDVLHTALSIQPGQHPGPRPASTAVLICLQAPGAISSNQRSIQAARCSTSTLGSPDRPLSEAGYPETNLSGWHMQCRPAVTTLYGGSAGEMVKAVARTDPVYTEAQSSTIYGLGVQTVIPRQRNGTDTTACSAGDESLGSPVGHRRGR